MESIGIIIDYSSELANFLKANLRSVFDKYIQINCYYLNKLKNGDQIDDDVVLLMSRERSVEAKRYIENSKKIVVLRRTIKEIDAYHILKIPNNTRVLVVNDTKETTLETVSLLYRIGIDHLSLVPYEDGKDYSDIKVAITPNVPDRVPLHIKKIMDIGNRFIDIATFIQIMKKLKINNKEIRKKLIKYADTVVTLDSGMKSHYKALYIKNEELDTVVNLSKEGILLVNMEDIILLCNVAFKKMFNIRGDIVGKNIESIFDRKVISIIRKKNVRDELIANKNKFITINRHKLDYIGDEVGHYLNFQEVTYIKQLEQNLTKKLRDKGFIARYSFDSIKTESNAMKDCIRLAKKLALSDLTVLISGKNGTGKELLAQSIHNYSKRSKQPFVAVNCAAISESLLESELFGYEGGSFTGALKEGKTGLFELANNGTILLDEIGDMPLSLQTRLLRVLQERQVMRIGSQRVINVNVRVTATTNKDLFDLVQKGLFREDLCYRVNVLPIHIPPLKRRREDIIPLLQHFIGDSSDFLISEEVEALLLSYSWPGNIRELQNVASYIALMNEEKINLENLPYYLLHKKQSFEKELSIIEEHFGIIKGIETIKLIDENYHLGKGIGRKYVERLLKVRNIKTSESEVRRMLQCLNKLGIITSSVGRKGSEITSYGRNFIKWAINRIDN